MHRSDITARSSPIRYCDPILNHQLDMSYQCWSSVLPSLHYLYLKYFFFNLRYWSLVKALIRGVISRHQYWPEYCDEYYKTRTYYTQIGPVSEYPSLSLPRNVDIMDTSYKQNMPEGTSCTVHLRLSHSVFDVQYGVKVCNAGWDISDKQKQKHSPQARVHEVHQ